MPTDLIKALVYASFPLGDPDIEAISLDLCEGLRDIAAAGMKLLMTLLMRMTSLCQLQRSHHTCQRSGNIMNSLNAHKFLSFFFSVLAYVRACFSVRFGMEINLEKRLTLIQKFNLNDFF